MADERVDPAEAVPAYTKGALDAEARERPDDRTYVSAPAFTRSLSPGARAAFGQADEFRQRRHRGGIDVEHLLVGLRGGSDDATPRAFERAGVSGPELSTRLRDAGLDAPEAILSRDADGRFTPTDIEGFSGTYLAPAPPLTQAVLDIVLAAERLASTGPMTAGVTGTPHLLHALAASPHPAARLFADVWKQLGDEPTGHEITPRDLDRLVGSLSVSSWRALGVADALRRGRGADAVHVEHLLVGLYVEQGGHQHARFDDVGIDATTLSERLRAFALPIDLAKVPDAGPVDRMPPLSAHATRALTAAADAAKWSAADVPTPGKVEARHLLAGLLGVRECHVVQAFDDVRDALLRGLVDAHETTPEKRRTGSAAGARNDQPAGEDRLRFTDYVSAFANLIDSPRTTPPLTVGIYGAWGSGKSFLLAKLVAEMKARRDASLPGRTPVYCVSFNAWEYNASPQIWPRLVRRVLDGVEGSLGPRARLVLRLHNLWPNVERKARHEWKRIAAFGLVFAFLVFVALVSPQLARGLFEFTIAKVDDKLTLATLIGGVTALLKLLVDSLFTPLGAWVTAALDDGRNYGLESGAMAVVRRDLERLDAKLEREGSRVLIVIDDLDRCEPEKAVEMLQAINLLLDRRSFIICLGIDARVITAAVEKHYEELLGPAGITGYEYLDKIIQIPFRIPDPNDADLKRFLSMQLGDPRDEQTAEQPRVVETGSSPADTLRRVGRDAAARGPQENILAGNLPTANTDNALARGASDSDAPGPSQQSTPRASPTKAASDAAPSFRYAELVAFEEVAPFLRPNPRHVKRLVNVYALVRSLAELGDNASILGDPVATVRWLTLCAQWPYATRCMLDHLDAQGVPADAKSAPLPALLQSVSATLDPKMRARYDHDAALLGRIVASSDGLSWDELRALRAYTVNFNPALDAELRVAR